MSHAIDTPRKKPSSGRRRALLPALLVIIGLVVMLYPVVASQWNNHVQQEAAQRYEDLVQDTDPVYLNEQVERARAYNEAHTDGPILDPWLARVNEDNLDYQEYLAQLEGASAMSHVAIPSIESSLPVYHGTTDAVLQKGLGHLYGSALPVGGEGNHTVITGHTGLTNATLWDDLINVKEGDAIYVSTYGERMKYEVHGIETVLPDETDSLRSVAGEDLLTLITCTPYGINTHRLLVHAHRVPMDPAEESVFKDSAKLMQWWMWLVVAFAALVLLALIWWVLRNARRNRAAAAATAATGDMTPAPTPRTTDQE